MITIDEVIAQYQEKAEYFKTTTNVSHALELKQIAEWLEEMKAIKSDGFTDDLLNTGFTKGYKRHLMILSTNATSIAVIIKAKIEILQEVMC